MTTHAVSNVNSETTLQHRLAQGRIPKWGPVLMVLIRPALAFLAQGITLVLFNQLGIPDANVAVRHWWSVYGTLVDIGCLSLLLWLIRQEGIRLMDLGIRQNIGKKEVNFW